MDFQTILYIAGGIIYLLYQGNEGRKKHRENQPKQSPPAKTWEQELEEMLKDKFPPKKDTKPQPVVIKEQKKPVPPKPKPKPAVTFEEEILKKKEKELAEYDKIGAGSIEYVDQPLFVHEETIEIGKEKEPEEGDPHFILKDFDPKKAFIYSEIFNRKY